MHLSLFNTFNRKRSCFSSIATSNCCVNFYVISEDKQEFINLKKCFRYFAVSEAVCDVCPCILKNKGVKTFSSWVSKEKNMNKLLLCQLFCSSKQEIGKGSC